VSRSCTLHTRTYICYTSATYTLRRRPRLLVSFHTPARARVPREQCAVCLCVRVFVCGCIIGKRIIYIYILLYYTSFNIKISNNKSAIILYILCVVFTRGGGGAGHRRSSSSAAALIQRPSGQTHTSTRARTI